MRVKGKISAGVLRGEQLIDKYTPRIIGLLGFEPFPGTLNVKLQNKIDLKFYATKTIEHILLNGERFVEAYLAPVRLHVREESYDCWAFRQEKNPHPVDVVEIIAKDNLREKFSLQDDAEVEIEFFDVSRKEEKETMPRLPAGETRISR